jgi:hypothetical protein
MTAKMKFLSRHASSTSREVIKEFAGEDLSMVEKRVELLCQLFDLEDFNIRATLNRV